MKATFESSKLALAFINSRNRAKINCLAVRFLCSDGNNLSGLSHKQIEQVTHRDIQLRTDYEVIKPVLNKTDYDDVRRKRMIYRSKQRGWLEVDILLGSWAAKNVPHLTHDEMDEYEKILSEETIDIFNYVSGKDTLPDHLQGLKVMQRLQEYALKTEVIDPKGYEELKAKNNLV